MERPNPTQKIATTNDIHTKMALGLASMMATMYDKADYIDIKDTTPNISKEWAGAPLSNDYTFDKDGIATKKIDIGRNEPCTCGSDKKYKKCCGK